MHKPTAVDTFNMLCGDRIGRGIHREVFECKLIPTAVVKVEVNDGAYRSFMNVNEMAFWNDNRFYSLVRKWLAPCHFLSPDGYILLQERVRPCIASDIKKLPKQLPYFLTDTKFGNYGWYQGRIVCCDYAIITPTPSVKMRKADWYE